MEKLEQYRHFFLYAKNWYKRSDNLFRDLGVILSKTFFMRNFPIECDTEYVVEFSQNWYKRSDKSLNVSSSCSSTEHKLKNRAFKILLKIVEEKKLIDDYGRSLLDFVSDVHPYNTWRFGYIHEQIPKNILFKRDQELKDYDYTEAVIRKCLSLLMHTEKLKFDELGEIDMNLQRKIFILQNIEELKNSKRI